jgi:multiple sugar transport system permease protein
MGSVVGLVLLLVFLFPIFWMMLSSLKTVPDLFAHPPGILPNPLDLSHWERVLGDRQVLRYVLNSVIIGASTCVLTLVLAAPAAYALARLPIRGKSALMLLNLSSLMFPAIMLATPLFIIFSRLHLIDSYPALILADTSLALPYAIILLRPAFQSVPHEISEAALMDGCSQVGAFRHVALPLARTGLATVAIFSFLWGWGDFVFALTLATTDTMRPVTTGLWAFVGPNNTDWGAIMAFSTIAILPPLVLFLIAQRHVVAGISAGGLKG